MLHEPLNYALQNYLTVHSLPLYRECVVCFSQIYDRNGPFDRVRDYDNLEFKKLLDTIATYIMVDDSEMCIRDSISCALENVFLGYNSNL